MHSGEYAGTKVECSSRFSLLDFNRIILFFNYCDEAISSNGAYSFYLLQKDYGLNITKGTLHFSPVDPFSFLCFSGSMTLTFFVAVLLCISNLPFSRFHGR